MRTIRLILAGTTAALLPLSAGAAGLAEVIRTGDRAAALRMVQQGANVNALADDGSSPLLWAVYRVDHELVESLLARGARPDQRNVLGAVPLAEAVALNDERMVAALLKAGADPDMGNEDGQTPLMLAARGGSLPVVEMLVNAGARVNAREQYRQQTALMWAVDARQPAIADFLIARGAQVEVRAAATDWGNQITSEPRAQYRPSGGLTPLLIAARSGCLDCVKSLLAAGADINRPTPDGVTPLMVAIDNSNDEVAMHLLEQGANPHLSDWWGRTVLYVAIDMHSRGRQGGGQVGPGGPGGGLAGGVRATDAPPPAAQAGPLQVAQRLLEMGVDPNT